MTTGLDAARYGRPGHPDEWAPTHVGMTADAERPGGQGMRIGFAVEGCPRGRLLVGATERGISMVGLGRSDAALEASLRTEYPAAEIVRDARGIHGWVRDVLDHLEGRQPERELPTDVSGTEFERQVWDALRAIPYGSTRSYGEIARARTAGRLARGGRGLRDQSDGRRGALPPRRTHGWPAGRIPLGSLAQARPAGR